MNTPPALLPTVDPPKMSRWATIGRAAARTVVGSLATLPVTFLVTLAATVPMIVLNDPMRLATKTDLELKALFAAQLTGAAFAGFALLHLPLIPVAFCSVARERVWVLRFFITMGVVSVFAIVSTGVGWAWLFSHNA